MKIKKIQIIENHKILFHYDCTRVEFFTKYWEDEEESPESKGTSYLVDWYNPCIWVRDINNIPTIAHELLHSIHHIARTVWIEYNRWSEEWFSYSLSHSLRKILAINK